MPFWPRCDAVCSSDQTSAELVAIGRVTEPIHVAIDAQGSFGR